MPAAFNPSTATITAPHVVRDNVTAFRLRAQRVASLAATVDVAVPTANPDGTYTVSLATLKDGIDPQFYGDALDLYVSAVSATGTSATIVDPNGFIYQPIPAAPESISIA